MTRNIRLRKFGETIRFGEYSRDAASWPWPTHQTTLLHYRGDDVATLQYFPDAVMLLLRLCLFHVFQRWFWLIWKINTRTKVRNTGKDTPRSLTLSGGRQRLTRARASPCPVQTYYSTKQPQEAVNTLQFCYRYCWCCCTIRRNVWYVPGMWICCIIRVHTNVSTNVKTFEHY